MLVYMIFYYQLQQRKVFIKMNEEKALEIINKIFNEVFEESNKENLDTILDKFAFDVKLPKQVNDSTTNEITWADSTNNDKFITNDNMIKRDSTIGWMLEKQDIKSLKDLIDIWKSINFTTTQRVYESVNVIKSDTIYGCENVYRSTDCRGSKNIVFCDSCGASEFLLACSRSGTCNFCIRCDDSKNCSNSYNVICSNKISNSLFIQDCFNLHECIFCSHISAKKYCIANMQFEEDEYYEYKKIIVKWILNS